MSSSLHEIVTGFQASIEGVQKLIDFDRDLLKFSADQLEMLRASIPQLGIAEKIKRTEATLRTVRTNDSFKTRFDIIHSQAVVLLVSYFGSTVEDIFKLGITVTLKGGAPAALRQTELKLTFGELEERGWDVRESAAELLIDNKDISFQDMQSISRAFREYFGLQTPQGPMVDNIIMAQACRHVIVHAGAIVTQKMLRQVRNADLRQLKKKVTAGQMIDFTPEELQIITTSMLRYVTQLAKQVEDKTTAF